MNSAPNCQSEVAPQLTRPLPWLTRARVNSAPLSDPYLRLEQLSIFAQVNCHNVALQFCRVLINREAIILKNTFFIFNLSNMLYLKQVILTLGLGQVVFQLFWKVKKTLFPFQIRPYKSISEISIYI